METVWSAFNTAGISARAMSLAYRWETLNHFLRDHNFKKMISMGEQVFLSSIIDSFYDYFQIQCFAPSLKQLGMD